MPAHITFVRHAQTEANVSHQWQGATDTPFSDAGHGQIKRLAERFAHVDGTSIVSSDLPRAHRTALALASDVETDVRWREPNVGEWEGRTFDEIRARWPEQLQGLLLGEDVSLGGGERMSDVAARLDEAFADLCSRLGDNGSAIVVSHGLALLTLTSRLLGTRRPAPLQLMGNTAITAFVVNAVGPQLVVYNDASHVDDAASGRRVDARVVLIRHGETDANVEGRWQGHGDWPLNAKGLAQARKLAPAVPQADVVYTSPLARAKSTAEVVAAYQQRPLVVEPKVKEIGFGSWENCTRAEIEATDPETISRLVGGEDIARGGTGETFSGVQERMTEAVDAIAARHQGGAAAVVSHGGATRAYLTKLLGIGFPERNRIRTMRNTAFAQIAFGPRGPALAEWNAAPHLDRGEGEASWAHQRV
jgi:probable phosphoglycerate mutase